MASDPVPVSHPSVFIREEMEARGWDVEDLATAMMLADDDNRAVYRLGIEMYFEVGPTDTNLRISPDWFARAFGVSEDLFVNLERSWLEAQVVSDGE